MTAFRVDRLNLPKPWANPLVFTLTNGETTLAAEVRQNAAIDYQSVSRGEGYALDRIETFVLSVEDAVERLIEDTHETLPTHMTLEWSDLNP